jgi:hypothetical protein
VVVWFFICKRFAQLSYRIMELTCINSIMKKD